MFISHDVAIFGNDKTGASSFTILSVANPALGARLRSDRDDAVRNFFDNVSNLTSFKWTRIAVAAVMVICDIARMVIIVDAKSETADCDN